MTDLRASTAPDHSPSALRVLVRDEWPYLAVLALALLGIAADTVFRTPMTLYWIVVAPLIGAICIYTQWRILAGGSERMRMARGQALHWIAVLVAIAALLIVAIAAPIAWSLRRWRKTEDAPQPIR